ncbi:FabD/lysophospholipase-like protein, partial [Plenodomus tracheiphilus IPT5]
ENTADLVYPYILFPFADVFCFFATDLGGFRQVAQRLAGWLTHCSSPSRPNATLPSVFVVTDTFPPSAAAESEALKAFLWMLGEETAVDPYERVSSIDIVAMHPKSAISPDARFRRLKERVMERSDQARSTRRATRSLFHASHLAALLYSAGAHFAQSSRASFDLVRATRTHNPVPTDLDEHLSNFLHHVTSLTGLNEFAAPMIASSLLLDSYPPDAHVFDCTAVFDILYKSVFNEVSANRVTAPHGTDDLICLVEKHLIRFFEQLTCGATAADIHRKNLAAFYDRWDGIQSSSTCLCCLRRRPQYCLPCGHCLCENCVVVFGDGSDDDPWTFILRNCFLCKKEAPNAIAVKVHPPTAGAGVLCIDGGGTRGIVPLILMKRIQDRLGMPIPLQRFVKVAFGVSIGAVIAMDHYLKGRPLSESIERFPEMMERSFTRRKSLNIPFLSRACQLLISYCTDGMYSAGKIESVLQEALGADSNILDCSYATSTGTKVGLPVATVSRHPAYRILTNYNGVGTRDDEQGTARAVSAAPWYAQLPAAFVVMADQRSFFPPKHIEGVGTFQDPGLLDNDPTLWAVSEAAALYPLPEKPDFVISLGTGEPGPNNYDVTTDDCRSVRGMFRRVMDLVSEKSREKTVKRVCRTANLAGRFLNRFHRLSVDFPATEPRLDDTKSIPGLISQVQADCSLTPKIDAVVRCLLASLFYFELDPLPRKCDGKYLLTGQILCSIRCNDPAFPALLEKVTSRSSRFLVNNWPLSGTTFVGKDGNFQVQVTAETQDSLTISLELDNAVPCNISGSPFCLQKLIAAQGLDAVFGRPDHRKRKRAAECKTLTKRRRITIEVDP